MDSAWWLLPFLVALVVGCLCPLTGTLLLLQRRLFLANLVSHAVLPGLALALALQLDPGFGGVVSGVAGALLAERFSRSDRPDQAADEAVLNTVLAGFLGLGVLLIPLLGLRVDLEALLFGDLLAATGFDLLRSLLALAAMLLLVVLRYGLHRGLRDDGRWCGAGDWSDGGSSAARPQGGQECAPGALESLPCGHGPQRCWLLVGDSAQREPAAGPLDRSALPAVVALRAAA